MTGHQPDVVVVGSVNADLRIEVDMLPRPGETIHGGSPSWLSGGKGANQAVALARLGRAVTLVGAVGSDQVSTDLARQLAAEGVNIDRLATVDGPAGQAVVFVDPSGENSIVVSPGANAAVHPDLVRRAHAELAGAKVVLAQLEIPVDAVLAAASATRGAFVLNPAPALPLPPELLSRVDVLVPNRGELAQLCAAALPVTVDEVAALARTLPCAAVVVTLGGDGALVVDGDTVRHLTPPAVTAVDTTGAGDCFCGALADALADGRPLVDAAEFAVRAAALSVTAAGAQASMPSREQVLALAASTGRHAEDRMGVSK
ncbi:ribokinase [Micromonospora sp. NPDC007271]|uniref:ribokinase n=1 Tax=Micromonospora sp. NPDC007271 TaxID=3154587 RepID=UPI0033C8902A